METSDHLLPNLSTTGKQLATIATSNEQTVRFRGVRDGWLIN